MLFVTIGDYFITIRASFVTIRNYFITIRENLEDALMNLGLHNHVCKILIWLYPIATADQDHGDCRLGIGSQQASRILVLAIRYVRICMGMLVYAG